MLSFVHIQWISFNFNMYEKTKELYIDFIEFLVILFLIKNINILHEKFGILVINRFYYKNLFAIFSQDQNLYIF